MSETAIPGPVAQGPAIAPRAPRRWSPRPASPAAGWALAAFAVAASAVAAVWWTSTTVRDAFAAQELASPLTNWIPALLTVLALGLFWPVLQSWRLAQRANALAKSDLGQARALSSAARIGAWTTFGYVAALGLALLFALFLVTNDMAVGQTFFSLPLMIDTFGLILSAFWINVQIFCIAEVLVLIWGLVVAIARLAPGAPGKPIRMIATFYVDLFRSLPAIIAVFLIGFGLPLTDLPIFAGWSPMAFAIIALTLTYGAYVSEVYRAGIESVHWSQTAAARSLGLSYAQTMRFVIVPQAVRRIIPPLLNDFISLQKDTALVSIVGTVDAFNQSKMIASNHFNLSSVTTVALLFVVITIPQARFVDRLIEADQKRRAAG